MTLPGTSPPRDSDEAFRVKTRRDRLFGLWAAERLGLSGREADIYARHVIMADMEAGGEVDLLHEVAADLSRYVSAIDEQVLQVELRRFEDIARDQLARENRRS